MGAAERVGQLPVGFAFDPQLSTSSTSQSGGRPCLVTAVRPQHAGLLTKRRRQHAPGPPIHWSVHADFSTVQRNSYLRTQKSPATFSGAFQYYAGDYLISHTLTRAVPSARRGLTSVFGMGTGVTLAVNSPANLRISLARSSTTE